MALIIDPDNLTDGLEISVLTGSKTVRLNVTGNLTASDGVTLKCVYSKLKELWKTDAGYIRFPFPMQPITDEQFELVNGWDFDKVPATGSTSYTPNLIRTGGWALKDANGISLEEWSGVVTLGSLTFATGSSRVYYQQNSSGSAIDTIFQSAAGVNQAVKVYSSGVYDYRTYMNVFIREYGYTYGASTLADIGVQAMTYQVYRFPLTNGSDLKIGVPDASMSIAPYNGMSINYYTGAQAKSGLVGGSANFHVVISGSNGSTQQIYEFVQYKLRQNSDIDAQPGSVIGKTAASLMRFVGDTLYTLQPATLSGTFIDSVSSININDVYFVDDTGANRYYPYSAVLILQFGDNLTTDSNAIYKVFFTNDDPPGDNLGYDFGTTNAIIANDNTALPITGTINGSGSISRTYDYDGNVQRGLGSSGSNAPITVVAIGLNTAQYVKAASTIQRSKSNTVSLVAPLERNYQNP